MKEVLTELAASVIEGSEGDCKYLTEQALAQGLSAKEVLDKGLMPGMNVVGQRFRDGDTFVPEVIRSAKAMQTGMNILKPGLMEAGVKATGKAILGTVKGDLHDIGKNLVGIMLGSAGFEVKDIGKDVSAETFVAAVKAWEPDILGMSALLTTTMVRMHETIEALQEAGLRERVKVIVGGAPVTQRFSDEIGADGYGANAAEATDLARRLLMVVRA